MCVCVATLTMDRRRVKKEKPQKAGSSQEKGLIQSGASAASSSPLSSRPSAPFLSLPEAYPSVLALLLTVLLWENKEMEKRGGEEGESTPPPHSPVARVEWYFPFTESTARLCSDLCESMCVFLNPVGHRPSP